MPAPTQPAPCAPPAQAVSPNAGNPFALAALEAPLASLPGIGPRTAPLLAKVAGGGRVLDLLFTMPEKLVDRRNLQTIAQARQNQPGTVFTSRLKVLSVRTPKRPGQPTIMRAGDGTGFLEAAWFRKGRVPLPAVGTEILISGAATFRHDVLTLNGPERLVPWAERGRFPWLDPVWPLTAGLTRAAMEKAIQAALVRLEGLAMPEWHDPTLVRQRCWPSFVEALQWLHHPTEAARQWRQRQRAREAGTSQGGGALESPPAQEGTLGLMLDRAQSRLAADELLASQLYLALSRAEAAGRQGRPLTGGTEGPLWQAQMLEAFGHPPTPSQNSAFAEIAAEMAAPTPMNRLLQGDVGAGKTWVAMMAMLQAAGSGAQAALMAPTGLLAHQHHATLSKLCPLPVTYLGGDLSTAERQAALEHIKSGEAKLIVGTHALFQDDVTFHDLGLAIVDEQHRFGVEQRLRLAEKARDPALPADMLVMTATPIPRTLQLARWGELGVSRLEGRPQGRLPVKTTLHDHQQRDEVMAALARALAQGRQVFWVCPLVEESEALSATAAEERRAALVKRFGEGAVGLAHGRQEAALRQAELARFREGESRILVATTVVEVGVDIPTATIMVIEDADRFGLAQLHQLRGRVGRGGGQSFCLLLPSAGAGKTALERLDLLRHTEDGFLIADKDYQMRGAGDPAGRRQSGLPAFRLAVGAETPALLELATREARLLLGRLQHPGASADQGEGRAALGLLLRLFGHDPARALTLAG
ncbi:ATP-dependent DNA helicase RecG [Formicincola oecophyllae]|uniref:ATP-dependent DNA helicase RecG n=1 Tax=Formicincola oecophyllae TaxID=2558361 RepID=UPI001F0D98D5|nr:ATP-dependent DNA helicase RecG [Formicincola oecophyllae]